MGRRKKILYLLTNIFLITLLVVLIVLSIYNPTMKDYFNRLGKLVLGCSLIFNGVWNLFTKDKAIIRNKQEKTKEKEPNWGWWVFIVVGIGYLAIAIVL